MPDRLSVTNPSVSTNVLGYGAFIGLHANMRYQLLCGFDRDVANHFEVIGVAMLLSTALRSLPPSFTYLSMIDISIYTLIHQITLVLMFCLLNFDWVICLFVSYDVNAVPIKVDIDLSPQSLISIFLYLIN